MFSSLRAEPNHSSTYHHYWKGGQGKARGMGKTCMWVTCTTLGKRLNLVATIMRTQKKKKMRNPSRGHSHSHLVLEYLGKGATRSERKLPMRLIRLLPTNQHHPLPQY